jgi:hypothetical protein
MPSQLNSVSLMLIMTIGPLPDARQTPAGRHESGDSLRRHWIRDFMAL